jgi:hypothetical protein
MQNFKNLNNNHQKIYQNNFRYEDYSQNDDIVEEDDFRDQNSVNFKK